MKKTQLINNTSRAAVLSLAFAILQFATVHSFALQKCSIHTEIETQYRQAKLAIKSNSLESIDKIQQAAFQGHAVAAHDLGFYYEKGLYLPRNYRLAYQWFKVSAARGQVRSMLSLASMNRKGEGRPVSLSAAYAWYRLAGKYKSDSNEKIADSDAAKLLEKKMSEQQLLRGKQLMQSFEQEIICKW